MIMNIIRVEIQHQILKLVFLIKKVCAKMDVQYNKKAADVKVDGKIDSTDAVLLVKYCAKMDIVLGQK